MSKICQITGKKSIKGHNRSHAMNATKRYFISNLHYHRFWVESEKKFIKLFLSSKGIRIIDKKGIDSILKNIFYKKQKNKDQWNNKK